ncbi:uncharacterized protein LOC110368365 isoform X2 [Fundulus heteroclitus]|uniref:uncharacterized protein LOC110368365 isoform X2 n=1 Tax=Fundulus heteroclitus TaxID=8078 RepID=UPI00165C23BC|nr:uncharacterized protein LOC110368365 isoform X2 [Fundulus heteroclitus]
MSKRRARLSPEAEAIQFILSGRDKPCLKVQWISVYKGRGVFACAPIEKGSFVAEYRGELISKHERDKRQKKYTENQNAFLFDFEWNSDIWCIDASHEDGSFGRIVNDDHKSPNCKMKKLIVKDKPHLCLFAIKNIQAECEITYDYGDSLWPWRALTPNAEIQTQPAEEPGMTETCTSSFQKLRARRRLQNLKRHHDRCEQQYDYTKMKILKRERQRTSSLTARINETISDPKSSDNTDYEDIDYIPDSSDTSSDSSVHSKELRVTEVSQKKHVHDISLGVATAHSVEISGFHSSSVKYCSADSTENMPQNNSSIKVTALTKRGRKSKYNKKQYCLYCKKPISKLARHLETAHRNQPDVAMAFGFAKGSHKRRELLQFLKKRGNFEHNATVAVQGAGAFVACRRPTVEKQSGDYRHCKHCQGLYARETLWRHVRRCPQKPFEGDSSAGRKRLQLELPKPDHVHEAVWKIACEMNQDDISLVVKSERDILRLGESLYNARKPHERRNDYIRQKMREIAMLLIAARAKTPLMRTEDLVMPSNFPHVIQAVRDVTGYDLESNSYKVPSLALKLGHSLAKVAGIVQCNAIIANRHDVAESAKQFSTLYQKKWAESISAAALGTLQQAKWNKPQLLPFTEEVLLLHQFLAAEHDKCMNAMKENPTNINFGNLAKVTLTQVVLFNRKRQGEVSKMEVQAFTSRNCTELNPDIMMCLNELERKLAKHFDRVEIRGKRSRMVAVLLTPDMVTAMNLLMENRSKCQVPTENVYLFARPGALSHYRGSDCLRNYANKCGAKNPDALTSTRLRKQVATLSTVLNLKKNEMDQLATFLGHDVRIHREFYRLPESTLQLAKISKLLIAMEKGKLSDLQGKGLDDINIDPEDRVATTDEDSDEETIAEPHEERDSRPETSGDPVQNTESITLRNREATSESELDYLGGTSTKTIVSPEPTDDSQQDTPSGTPLKCSNKKQEILFC